MDKFTNSANPGAHLVDTFPILDKLPDVFAPWRKDAIEQQAFNIKTYTDLLNGVTKSLETGSASQSKVNSFAAMLVTQREKLGLDELDIAYLAGTM